MNIEVLWDGTYGLSSLSEKTRKSNRLQMSLQRQHFLLSYLKTLSVGPAGVRTHDLPHGSPVLNQLSQPVGVTIQMKATEQYFPVVLFIMLYKVVLTFESVDEILKCDHWNESYCPVVLFIILCKVILTFKSVDEILKCDHSNESYWAVLSCGLLWF